MSNYSSIFFLGFTAYAIVSKRLFEIRVILTEILVAVIGILLLIQAILSDTILEFSWKSFIFITFLVFGYFLIKSVLREIELREKLQKTYSELQKLDKAKTEFLSMVNNLLKVSGIESGKIELKLEKVAIEDIISSVIKELKPKAKKKAIYLKWEKPTRVLPKIYTDQGKIRQVILNVIDNGIRYTNQGGVTVKTQSLEHLAKIRVIVSDTGEGMTEEEIDYLFEGFPRGKAGKRLGIEGTGLGLYMAKKFVELHQGRIWAESAGKGKGSTFYIELPIK